MFFWRDNVGNEVDLLIDEGSGPLPVEIKAGQTITEHFFKGIRFWNKLTDTTGGIVIYAGNTPQDRSNGIRVVPFHQVAGVLVGNSRK